MTNVRELYLTAAGEAVQLLATPQVAAAWADPSALEKLSVQGLAGHLAGQIFVVSDLLAAPVPTEEVISIHEYYARSTWIGADLDDPFNADVRAGGERQAGDSPAGLAARAETSLRELRPTLLAAADRPVRRPNWGPWSISLGDFMASRLLELAVHSDDLAYSVGVATPELPAEAVQLVIDLLSRTALRRHGAVKVLRALSRAERASGSIAAI